MLRFGIIFGLIVAYYFLRNEVFEIETEASIIEIILVAIGAVLLAPNRN